MQDSSKWLRLMMLAFVANGLGPFGLKVLAEKGLAEKFHFQYLVWWYAGWPDVWRLSPSGIAHPYPV
jgi:hypothetical protein